MIHKIRFEEIASYEVEVDIPEGVDPAFENPDGPWLQLLDQQAPDWIRTSGVVNERTVLKVNREDWV